MKLAKAYVVVCTGTLALLGLAVPSDGQHPDGPALFAPVVNAGQTQPSPPSRSEIERLPPVEHVARRDASADSTDTESPGNSDLLLLPSAAETGSAQAAGVDRLPIPGPEQVQAVPIPETLIPRDAAPWWEAQALRPMGESPTTISVDVGSLIVEALRFSSRVQAISDNAVIAETNVIRADAEFDTRLFMETKLNRTSIPTGSTLEAGANVPRLREEDWFYRAGLRKKNVVGGKFEAAQRIGTRNSNSVFFLPEDQGNARLTLSYNQPLLNGYGVAYNTSLIVLARFDTRIAVDRSVAELQEYLLEVTETLWQLYLQRSVLLQQQKHFERAQSILTRLESRRDLDSLETQIARARAAVALRRTAVIRAKAAIRDAESRLRALVNAPDLLADRTAELVPTLAPGSDFVPVDFQRALITALENRPDLDSATQEVEAARVRLGVAKNELLPVLDAVLETYVSGLRGDYRIGDSWVDQFSVGEPGYTAGLVFEVPLGRRAAKANTTRRSAELRQLVNRFQATVETVTSEVEVAVREVETAYRELQAKYEAMRASDFDMQYLQGRWETMAGEDNAASFMLEDLLDSQDRAALAEFNFAQGQIEYALSLTRLNRALGTLLKQEQVVVVRGCEEGVPRILFEKHDSTKDAVQPHVHD